MYLYILKKSQIDASFGSNNSQLATFKGLEKVPFFDSSSFRTLFFWWCSISYGKRKKKKLFRATINIGSICFINLLVHTFFLTRYARISPHYICSNFPHFLIVGHAICLIMQMYVLINSQIIRNTYTSVRTWFKIDKKEILYSSFL
jgi:hypothetical protein